MWHPRAKAVNYVKKHNFRSFWLCHAIINYGIASPHNIDQHSISVLSPSISWYQWYWFPFKFAPRYAKHYMYIICIYYIPLRIGIETHQIFKKPRCLEASSTWGSLSIGTAKTHCEWGMDDLRIPHHHGCLKKKSQNSRPPFLYKIPKQYLSSYENLKFPKIKKW